VTVHINGIESIESAVDFIDGPALDAFSRLRVSSPFNIFDSKQIFDAAPLFWDDREVSGADTTSVYSQNAARSRLGVAETTVGKRVRQTFMRFNYHPGKSQLVYMTGVLGVGGTGITQEIGLLDDENGIFFRNDKGTVNVIIQSKVTGSVVDTAVAQSAWNLDVMDGTGPSGITVDWSKVQIFVIDYTWLSAGNVRIGLRINRVNIIVHEFSHANVIATAFMSTPNLPLRYSIENDGTGAASTLDHICATVISEGGVADLGIVRHASSNGATLDAAATATTYAVLGIKLKAAALGATIKLISLGTSEFAGSNAYDWLLLFNPTVAGTFTYADETNSVVQIARGAVANTVTVGIQIAGGVAQSAQRGSATTEEIESALRLGSTIAGVPDEMVLCVTPRNGDINLDIEGSMTWRELS
jgi:hypothetical protein